MAELTLDQEIALMAAAALVAFLVIRCIMDARRQQRVRRAGVPAIHAARRIQLLDGDGRPLGIYRGVPAAGQKPGRTA